MTVHIFREQARRFLALYHFTPTDLMGTIERLAKVRHGMLLDRHRMTDRRRYARFNAHAVGAQVSGEVSGGYL